MTSVREEDDVREQANGRVSVNVILMVVEPGQIKPLPKAQGKPRPLPPPSGSVKAPPLSQRI